MRRTRRDAPLDDQVRRALTRHDDHRATDRDAGLRRPYVAGERIARWEADARAPGRTAVRLVPAASHDPLAEDAG